MFASTTDIFSDCQYGIKEVASTLVILADRGESDFHDLTHLSLKVTSDKCHHEDSRISVFTLTYKDFTET